MLVLEFIEENQDAISDLKKTFPNCKIIEVNSSGAETVVQAIIDIAPILAASPVVIKLLDKIFEDRKVTAKYDGIEVSGGYKKVMAMIKEIDERRRTKSEGVQNEKP